MTNRQTDRQTETTDRPLCGKLCRNRRHRLRCKNNSA